MSEAWRRLPKYRIGYRTLKTALGAGISIGLARFFDLDFYSSAAIITILCISVTRRHSLIVSWARILACVLALLLSASLFELIGYHPVSLSLFLLLFIPLVVVLKIQEGLVTSCVILLHIYVLQEFSWTIFLNELYLIIIGVGVALCMNLYMPSDEKELRKYRREIEKNISNILNELATYLREGNEDWDGKEINESVQVLKDGRRLASRSINNQLIRFENHYYHYFLMREKQFEVIERMMPFVSVLHANSPESQKVARFIEELAKAVSPNNYVAYFLGELAEIRNDFRKLELPKSQQEFEERSNLSYILYELEQYLLIKDRLWNEVDKTDLKAAE
ncbi:aromatic acid exporter family protein [Alkalihalobacillus pseudalcaliphilus]|uniref:aromatic acid exporter family protein n=1 Tax=Alkalihalobacillus pseudalcaliphilus TaxID=79884 RepID=UPI000A4BAA14